MIAATLPRGYTTTTLDLGGMAQPARINFHANLNRFLKERDRAGNPVSEQQIAEACGVSLRSVRRWIDGDLVPRFDNLDALAGVFGKHVLEFFEDETVEIPEIGLTLERAIGMVTRAAALGQPKLASTVAPKSRPTKRNRTKRAED